MIILEALAKGMGIRITHTLRFSLFITVSIVICGWLGSIVINLLCTSLVYMQSIIH